MSDDKATAHHEAGHAILAMAFGWQVQRATMEPANVDYVPKSVPAAERIAVLAAGSAAEAKFTEAPPAEFGGGWWGTTGIQDNRFAMGEAYKALGKRVRANTVLNDTWLNVYAYFQDGSVWAATADLAECLLAVRELAGEATAAVWQAHPDAHPVIDVLRTALANDVQLWGSIVSN